MAKKSPKLLMLPYDTWTAIGLWTKPGAPFFCIEPWWGWADALDASGMLKEKQSFSLRFSRLRPNHSIRTR